MSKRKEFKKKLEDFVKDETGSVSKDKVLKISLGTISALGIMASFSLDTETSYGTHTSHSNNIAEAQAIEGVPVCVHSSHSSY